MEGGKDVVETVSDLEVPLPVDAHTRPTTLPVGESLLALELTPTISSAPSPPPEAAAADSAIGTVASTYTPAAKKKNEANMVNSDIAAPPLSGIHRDIQVSVSHRCHGINSTHNTRN